MFALPPLRPLLMPYSSCLIIVLLNSKFTSLHYRGCRAHAPRRRCRAAAQRSLSSARRAPTTVPAASASAPNDIDYLSIDIYILLLEIQITVVDYDLLVKRLIPVCTTTNSNVSVAVVQVLLVNLEPHELVNFMCEGNERIGSVHLRSL